MVQIVSLFAKAGWILKAINAPYYRVIMLTGVLLAGKHLIGHDYRTV